MLKWRASKVPVAPFDHVRLTISDSPLHRFRGASRRW